MIFYEEMEKSKIFLIRIRIDEALMLFLEDKEKLHIFSFRIRIRDHEELIIF